MQIRIEDLVAALALVVADLFLEWGMIALIAAMFYGALGYLAFDCRRKNYHHGRISTMPDLQQDQISKQ